MTSFTELLFQPRHLPLRPMPLPGDGVVDLWFLDLVKLGSPLQPDKGIDPADFAPRLQRTLRRFYLRLLLGAYLGIPGKDVAVSRAVRGKPVLESARHGNELDFSMAASGGCCLIGFSASGLLGVDMELRGRKAGNPLALARRYFSAGELAALAEVGPDQVDEAFLHTWACKEAMVKAAGHGIANRLCRFSVDVRPWQSPAVLEMDDDQASAWRLAVVRPGKRHVGAVAMRNPALQPRGFSLAPAP